MTKEITRKASKKEQLEAFFPPNPESSRLMIGVARGDYSATRIAHAVEDADASLLNLNVTSLGGEGSRLVVALRVDHRDPERVARSLERYGYEVTEMVGLDDPLADTARDRIRQILHDLDL